MSTLATPVPAGSSAAADAVRPRRVVLGRRLAVAALVVGSLLNAAESLLARRYLDADGSPAERAAAITAHELPLTVALTAGIVAIPFMALAFQALAHLVRPQAPRLAAAGAGLTFAGCFGFLAIHVTSVVELAATKAGVPPAQVDAVLSTVETSPLAGLLLATFLVGLFGGTLCLTVGLWRSRAVARWVPGVLLLFLVLDLLAAGRLPVDPHPLFVAGCLGAAAVVARRTDEEWENA